MSESAMPAAVPVVSVVVPCFNRAHLIQRVVESVRNQSFAEWELIVVDDGSRDDLALQLHAERDDPRIRLIRHESNRGVSAARNTGVAAARGRFVAFLDSDDDWLPRKLELQLAAVMSMPDPEQAFCVTRTEVRMADGWSRTRPLHGPDAGTSFSEYLFNEGGFAQCSSFFVSTALARRTPFREGLRQYEDHLFFAEAGRGGAVYRLVPEVLTVWRNDARPDRLGAHDNLAQARLFMRLAEPVLPPRALLGFEARAVFHLLWRTSPSQATRLMWRAVREGALTPRQGAILFGRHIVPAPLYEAIRRGARRIEHVRSRAAS